MDGLVRAEIHGLMSAATHVEVCAERGAEVGAAGRRHWAMLLGDAASGPV
ncbi:MAG: hypothetical protein JWQ43_3469 [Glaciihabitans sp.]|nr:hypothetical protein [Glaciihabitans sp.]